MDHELDAGDLDAIRELRGMHGYTLVFVRITAQIKRHVEELIQPSSGPRSDYIRGQIAALRMALEIPEIIESEARVVGTETKKHAR